MAQPGSAKARGVNDVIKRIRTQSAECVDELFRDGTAENPDAGLLVGDGFSYSDENCAVDEVCDGGDGGALRGDGGDGHNGGNGGNAGWYGGKRCCINEPGV